MAVVENDVLMKFKDSSGNINLLYPITRKDDVDGLIESIRDQSVTTSGDGSAYTATVEGITSLSAGVSFVMIPHVSSTSTGPTLNVNGLGAKLLRRRVSSSIGTTTSGISDDWLSAGKPVNVMYDGTFWVVDLPRPNANDIMGAVAIQNGGTGATTVEAARNALGLGNTSGALPIENGGTGATTAAAARNALGLGNTTGALPIANGGTGATTASAARSNLGAVNMVSTTATLATASWSSNAQTVSVSGVTASNTVIVGPSPASYSTYGESNVRCTAQASGTLTFTCDSTPTSALTVNVIILT